MLKIVYLWPLHDSIFIIYLKYQLQASLHPIQLHDNLVPEDCKHLCMYVL